MRLDVSIEIPAEFNGDKNPLISIDRKYVTIEKDSMGIRITHNQLLQLIDIHKRYKEAMSAFHGEQNE